MKCLLIFLSNMKLTIFILLNSINLKQKKSRKFKRFSKKMKKATPSCNCKQFIKKNIFLWTMKSICFKLIFPTLEKKKIYILINIQLLRTKLINWTDQNLSAKTSFKQTQSFRTQLSNLQQKIFNQLSLEFLNSYK